MSDGAEVLLAQSLLEMAHDAVADEAWTSVVKSAPQALQRGRILRRELARSYVSQVSKGSYPGDDHQRMATWLDDLTSLAWAIAVDDVEAVAKAGTLSEEFEAWANRRVRRLGGRFAPSTATGSPQRPEKFKRPGTASAKEFQGPGEDAALQMGLRYGSDDRLQPMTGVALDRQKVDQFLSAQREAQVLETELRNAFGSDAKHIKLTLNLRHPTQDKAEQREVKLDQLRETLTELDPDEEVLTGLQSSIDTSDLDRSSRNRVRAKAVNATLGASLPRPLRTRSESGPPQIGSLPPNAASGAREKVATGTRVAGQLLSGVGATTAGTALQTASQALSSDAAAALAPYAERAAMRYTGSRVKPSRETVKIMGDGAAGGVLTQLEDLSDTDFVRSVRGSLPADLLDRAETLSGERTAAQRQKAEGFSALAASLRRRSQMPEGAYAAPPSRDSITMGARSDLAALAMSRKLPDDPATTALSFSAGRTLPSRGVVIDGKGNVLYEAVGRADDHYTPFSGDMLAALRGGQYVRTRTSGGPSMEDIRTVLTSGARRATVVSPAGVYEVELDPDARGGRRAAAAMQGAITSYAAVLEQVQSSGMYLGELPPEQMRRIETDAVLMYPGPDQGKARADHIKNETSKLKISMAAESMGMHPADFEESARNQIASSGQDLEGPEFDEQVKLLSQKMFRDRVRPLMLNGEGYDLALRTWAQRHPDLVRSVSYRPMKQFYGELGLSQAAEGVPSAPDSADRGYVGPGSIRPSRGGARAPQPDQGETPQPGGAPAQTPAASSAAPEASATPSGPPVQPTTPVGQALEPVGGRVDFEMADALGELDINTMRFGDPDQWAQTMAEVADGKAVHPVVATVGTMFSADGPQAAYERVKADPKLRETLLRPINAIQSDITGHMSMFMTPGDSVGSEMEKDNVKAQSKPVAQTLQAMAVGALMSKPNYTMMPPQSSTKDNPLDPVLSRDMIKIGSQEDYAQWRDSGSEDAVVAKAGRDMLAAQLPTPKPDGTELVASLVDGTRKLWSQATRIINERPERREQALAGMPMLDPDIKRGLTSDSATEQKMASDRLLNSIRLGFSSALLASQLEADAFASESGGGVGPKAWMKDDSHLVPQVVLKADPRLTISTLRSRRVFSTP